eukprot:9489939-Pyramimonas_sp.AAC.3
MIHTTALNIHITALNIHITALNIRITALNIHITALNIHITESASGPTCIMRSSDYYCMLDATNLFVSVELAKHAVEAVHQLALPTARTAHANRPQNTH